MAKKETAGASAPAELTLEQAVAQLEAAKAENAKLAKKADDLEAELKDSAEIVADLKEQLKEASKGKKRGPIVKIGKDSYRVLGGTVIKKKPYKPEDLAADAKISEALIEKGSKLFVKIK